MISGGSGKKEQRRRTRWSRAALWPVLAAAVLLAPSGAARADLGDGKVTDRLDEKAEIFRKWLPSALQGHAQAQFEVGVAFATGRAEPEDYAEAARWFEKAAEQGNARAQNGLAILYTKGMGVERDYVQAYVWFELAAERFGQGMRRDQALELRNMMAAFMTEEQLAEAKRLVRERKAAGAGE